MKPALVELSALALQGNLESIEFLLQCGNLGFRRARSAKCDYSKNESKYIHVRSPLFLLKVKGTE